MATTQAKNCCCLRTFDEHSWVMRIRQVMDEEIQDDVDIHVSICTAPKPLRDITPNAYTPQLVAIGPYHHWRSELQEMERYKLSSAKRILNKNRSTKLYPIVDRLVMLEHKIRACYHTHVDINGETLSWMMAIDSAFLLEFMNSNNVKQGMELRKIPSRMSHLVDYSRRKAGHSALLGDIIMLENQIPLFVLSEMLHFQSHPSEDIADTTLDMILIELCKELSPFKTLILKHHIQPSCCEHILDFLYKSLVPKVEETIEIKGEIDQEVHQERTLSRVITKLKGFLGHAQVRFIFELPLIFICGLPGFSVLRPLLLPHQEKPNDQNTSQSTKDNKPLLVEEISIPSVIELSKSGVTFEPIDGDTMAIKFDTNSATFHLPSISIDVNTEIVLRNLVAYEASCCLGPLVFARYIELMNGIIDTKDDVRLLRERGIILNYLKSDEEVAQMWNGMCKSLRLTRVPFLDEVIENVNAYYEGHWKVLLCRFFKAYMFISWRILAFLVATLILFLLTLQVWSMFYNPRMVGRLHRG